MTTTLAQLQRDLFADGRHALLVEPRRLRQLLTRVHGLSPLQLPADRLRALQVPRDVVLHDIPESERSHLDTATLPETLHLLSLPPEIPDEAGASSGILRWELWRRLFDSHIAAAYREALDAGRLTSAVLAARLRRIGTSEVDEVRRVLRAEGLLLPPEHDDAVYIAFVAHVAELRHFEPALLEVVFPAIAQLDLIESMLATDLDVRQIHQRTRLPGATAPIATAHSVSRQPVRDTLSREALLAEATRRSKKGDRVGAAIAERLTVTATDAGELPEAVGETCQWLVDTLSSTLAVDRPELLAATQSLFLTCAAPLDAAARILLDLQRAALDRVKRVETIDLVEWALSVGRRPIRRPLPAHHLVRQQRHLRAVLKKIPLLPLDSEAYPALHRTLHLLAHRADAELRDAFRPRLLAAFTEVGFVATGRVAQVSLNNAIAFLLDELLTRGFLNFGILRDALARSALKLPDVTEIRAFIGGDPLLRLDRALSVQLDGVYHRGEIYLRILQRASSLFFGTNVGRAIVRYAVLPVGGGFIILGGLQYLLNMVGGAFGAGKLKLTTPLLLGLTALLLLGLLHWPAFRSAAARMTRYLGRCIRAVVWDAPRYLFALPLVQRIWRSTPLLLLRRFVVLPLLLGLIPWAIVALFRPSAAVSITAASVLFLLGNLAANSARGRLLLDSLADWLFRAGRRLRYQILPGLLRWIVDTFRQAMLALERLLYWVDNHLRFTQGDKRWTIPFKAVFGVVWFAITYVVRIYVTLLIEPQVNPIKHFPVVTLSHKLILPFTITLTQLFSQPLSPLGPVLANAIAGTTVVLLPGVFGFLVWEFKENWRMYAANRRPRLEPQPIGSHGETMVGLLRPGFHSGTIPKLFAKLRNAERRALRHGQPYQCRRLRNDLAHVSEAVSHFVEREMLQLLERDPGWRRGAIRIDAVRLSPARVQLGLAVSDSDAELCWVTFHETSGVLVGRVDSAGWSASLGPHQAGRWALALRGLFSYAGVDVGHAQLQRRFPEHEFEISRQELLVWPSGRPGRAVTYRLDRPGVAQPHHRDGALADGWPSLDLASLRAEAEPPTWSEWCTAWDTERQDEGLTAG